MEISCSRCHQPVDADSCYCPSCGLPQLVYSSEANGVEAHQEKLNQAVSDASVVEWRPALRAAMLLALPAGLLSSEVSPAGLLSLFWMISAAAWAVSVYVRTQRPAWITTGAGARIGLVTGLMAASLSFSITGVSLFVQRFALHQGAAMDAQWRTLVDAMVHWIQSVFAQAGIPDQGQYQAQTNLMLSPEGHAAYQTLNSAGNNFFMVLFAMAGGALGARFLARSRRRQV